MNILPGDLFVLTSLVLRAGCPLALVLEGGYGPSHGQAVSCIFSALHRPEKAAASGTKKESTQKLVSLLKKVHRLP
jgi:hypothetical protein